MDNVNNNSSSHESNDTASFPNKNINPSSSSSSSFWNSSTRALPGHSLRSPNNRMASSNSSQNKHSFQTYQDSVSDAWELGDDEFCIVSGLTDTKISRRVSQSAAMNVIKTHRSSNLPNTHSTIVGAAINNNHSSHSTTADSKDRGPLNNNHYETTTSRSSSSSTQGTNSQNQNLPSRSNESSEEKDHDTPNETK